MISTTDIIDVLKQTLHPDPFKAIEGASDLLEALDQLKASPSAFVLPSAKRSGPDRALTGVISQIVTVQVSIVIAFSRVGTSKAARGDGLMGMEEALIDCMVGWRPDGFSNPFTYGGGRLLGLGRDQGAMFWGSDFVAAYHLRK